MNNTLQKISSGVGSAFITLEGLIGAEESAKALVNSLGWQLPPGINDLGLAALDIVELREKLEKVINISVQAQNDYTEIAGRVGELLSAVAKTVLSLETIIKSLQQLNLTAYLDTTKILSDFVPRLLDLLMICYLADKVPPVYASLRVLGLIETERKERSDAIFQTDHIRMQIRYDRIPKYFSSQATTLPAEIYGWGTNNLKYELLLGNFSLLLQTLGAKTQFSYTPKEHEELLLGRPLTTLEAPRLLPQVYLKIYEGIGSNLSELGILCYSIRNSVANPTAGGIGLMPFIHAQAAFLVDLPAKNWKLEVDTDFKLKDGIAVKFLPDMPPQLDTSFFNKQGNSAIESSVALKLIYGNDTTDFTIIALSKELKLTGKKLYAKGGLEYDGTFSPLIELALQKGCISIGGGKDDGFLAKLLPEGGFNLVFDITVGWSKKRGLYFSGSAALEIKIPTHLSIGPINLDSLTVTIRPESGTFKLTCGADIIASLGPLVAVVQNIGISTAVSFPDDKKGNLGALNLNLGFKPPSGIGVSLDTAAVNAGGYLLINPDEYIGAIEIQIKSIKLAIKAVGIINTRLPGGQQGYSILIIITAEFSPINIGFGFTLNGVGGLFGLKRRIDPDGLRAGIKDKTLDSILFPKDVIKNITKIVADLKRVFPATDNDSFLIGPMVKIGWGSPSLVTAEIGVIIQIPEPIIITILGIVRVLLPDPEKAILVLQINFMGIIDFEKKLLTIDASLQGSRILTMTLTGQFALRLGWGSSPVFIFSSGGFHPDFKEAPPDLQKMARLGIQILDEKDIKIGVDTYFALTTNTVQFGANIHFFAKSGPYTANAGTGLDALIQFNPFFFQISIYLTGRINGPFVDVFIDVHGNLSGPNLWHIWGNAHAKMGPFEITIPVDQTFGDVITELEAGEEDVLKLLKEEISKDTNWRSTTVIDSASKVTIREISGVAQKVIVHPHTILAFNQRLVPLDTNIQKFGNKGVGNNNRFSISAVSITGVPPNATQPMAEVGTTLFDSFAPGNFYNIPKDQKLSRPSFENMKSGNEMKLGAIDALAGYAVVKPMDYEITYIQKKKKELKIPIAVLSGTAILTLATGGAAAKSKLSFENNRESFHAPPKIKIKQAMYSMANMTDLAEVTNQFTSQAEAESNGKELKKKDTIILSTMEI
ncbi:MAG: DUF6603 domain-containing protein [Flavisolibacter sp.]